MCVLLNPRTAMPRAGSEFRIGAPSQSHWPSRPDAEAVKTGFPLAALDDILVNILLAGFLKLYGRSRSAGRLETPGQTAIPFPIHMQLQENTGFRKWAERGRVGRHRRRRTGQALRPTPESLKPQTQESCTPHVQIRSPTISP